MSDAKAQIEITASTARLPAALQRAASMFKTFVSATGNAVESGAQHIGGTLARAAFHSLAFRGLDLVVDQAHQSIEFERNLTRFGIAARIAGYPLREVAGAIRDVSSQTGLNAGEVLRGARAYVDLAGAGAYTTDKMSLIARAAQASGSDINDMSTVVYALQHSLNIPNSELENTIGGLINLSKDGAVHFNQMAQELIGLAPVFAQFGIQGRQGAIQLASQLEVVRTGFGSASEAATGLLRLYRSLPQHAKLFDKAGVQIFKPGSRKDLLTLGEILNNIKKSSLEQDRPALIKAFGRGEAERSYQLLDKLLSEYHDLEEAGKRNGVVQQDLGTYTASAAGRIDIAVTKMKNSIAEAFNPEAIEGFATALEGVSKTVSAIGTVIGGLTLLGHHIGGGKSPEEERTEVLARRMNERKTLLAAMYEHDYLKKHPSQDPSDPDFIERRDRSVNKELGLEQSIEDKLQAQISGKSIKRSFWSPMVGPLQPGQGRPEIQQEAGNYTVPELRRLKSITSQASDRFVIEKLIDMAIAKQTESIDKMVTTLKSLIPIRLPQIGVAIDGKNVATAADNSPNNRRK